MTEQEARNRTLALLYIASTNGTDTEGATDMIMAMIAQRNRLVRVELPKSVRPLNDAEKNVQHLIQSDVLIEPYRARCMTIDLVERGGLYS